MLELILYFFIAFIGIPIIFAFRDALYSRFISKLFNSGSNIAIKINKEDLTLNITNIANKVRLEEIKLENIHSKKLDNTYIVMLAESGGGPGEIPLRKQHIDDSDIRKRNISIMKGVYDLEKNESADLFLPTFKYAGENLLVSYSVNVYFSTFNNLNRKNKIKAGTFNQFVFSSNSVNNLDHINLQQERTFFINYLSIFLLDAVYTESTGDSSIKELVKLFKFSDGDTFFWNKDSYFLDDFLIKANQSNKKINFYIYDTKKNPILRQDFILTQDFLYEINMEYGYSFAAKCIALKITEISKVNKEDYKGVISNLILISEKII